MASRGSLEGPVDQLRCAVETECERPCDGSQHGRWNPRRHAAGWFDDVPDKAVVLITVDPDGDGAAGPHVSQQPPEAVTRIRQVVKNPDGVHEIEAAAFTCRPKGRTK